MQRTSGNIWEFLRTSDAKTEIRVHREVSCSVSVTVPIS